MDAFIQKFCEKYSLPIALSLQLLDNMEKFTFHKGDFLVQEGGRNSNFYIVSKGIWRGHYLNDGVDVSVWFASEGEAIFSSWGYVENTVSLYNPQIQISVVSGTKRSIFRQKNKTKRSKKKAAHNTYKAGAKG